MVLLTKNFPWRKIQFSNQRHSLSESGFISCRSPSLTNFRDISFLICLISLSYKHIFVSAGVVTVPLSLPQKTYIEKIITANLCFSFCCFPAATRHGCNLNNVISFFGFSLSGKFKRKLFLEASRLYLSHVFHATLELMTFFFGCNLIKVRVERNKK